MRIAVTADPYLPVPPVGYGGIERVVDFLVRGLVARGHDVTLLANAGSRTPARLVPYGRPPHTGTLCRGIELAQVGSWLWRNRGVVDVVHSFGRLAALLPVLASRDLAKVQSYQRDAVPWRSVRRAARLAGGSILFTGCSSSVYRSHARGEHNEWRTVFNGVDLKRYAPVAAVASDAPLVFLGRLEAIKGAHSAIAIARLAGRRLILAGNIVESPEGRSYFDTAIAPFIDDGAVTYVGEIDDAQKNSLLGRCAALLMPIEWDEPFGIVMVEAMACGTPVIAFPRGSVPEVIRHGVNGFVASSIADAAACVGRVAEVDRAAVRADCERRFGADVITEQYERLYATVIARCA